MVWREWHVSSTLSDLYGRRHVRKDVPQTSERGFDEVNISMLLTFSSVVWITFLENKFQIFQKSFLARTENFALSVQIICFTKLFHMAAENMIVSYWTTLRSALCGFEKRCSMILVCQSRTVVDDLIKSFTPKQLSSPGPVKLIGQPYSALWVLDRSFLKRLSSLEEL